MSRRGQADPEPPENHERWIVTYADMVTLLFALFVVLWAMSNVDEEKFQQVSDSLAFALNDNIGILDGREEGTSPVFDTSGGALTVGEHQANTLVSLRDQLATLDTGEGLGTGSIQVRADEASITVSLTDNLLFSPASAALKPGSGEALLAIAEVLRDVPNTLRIEGHTDNIAPSGSTFADNLELSSARANAVLRFMASEGGIDATRMEAVALADSRPAASNDTPEGRSLNRRADIVILYDNNNPDPTAPLENEFAPSTTATQEAE